MKKLFSIYPKESFFSENDQFDGFVIRADNEETAWKLAEKTVKDAPYFNMKYNYFTKENFSIKEISAEGEDEIILVSYING